MDTNSKEWLDWSFKETKKLQKLKTDEDLLTYFCDQLAERRNRWKILLEEGCNDPSNTDGCNIWLVRNHIINCRKNILMLCLTRNYPIPDCFYEPSPPKVDRLYMANLHPSDESQKRRIERLSVWNNDLTDEKPFIPLSV